MSEERKCKYPDWSRGEDEALLNVLKGTEVPRRMISGELTVQFGPGVLTIIKAIRTQFSKRGILIPSREGKSAVCEPNFGMQLQQPALDEQSLALYFARLAQFGLDPGISREDFIQKILGLLDELSRIKNASKAICLPILIPRMPEKDLGETTERLVSVVAAAYQQQFPGWLFTNYHQGQLAGKVVPFPGANYENLMSALKEAPVAGLYLPSSMLGFSLNAQREQVQSLSQRFTLTGTIEPAIGWVMYTGLMAASLRTPVYDCSAVQDGSSGRSFGFDADVGSASFFYERVSPASAYDDCSGGLLFR
jgi:hypothetical protein